MSFGKVTLADKEFKSEVKGKTRADQILTIENWIDTRQTIDNRDFPIANSLQNKTHVNAILDV